MKHVQDMRSVQSLKTLRGERMGSMPKEGRSLFLDLYLQEKEKERLLQEITILNKKILLNQKKLGGVAKHINSLRNNINAEDLAQTPKFSGKIQPLKVENFENSNRSKNKKKRR